MTRKIIYLILPLLLLVFVPSVNAQNTTTGSAQTTIDAATKLREQMKLIQEQKKAEIKQIKDEAKVMIQAKREEFKASLLKIKDQKKKALVERIDAKIAEVNKNQTTRFTEALNRLQTFLDKISKSTTKTTVLVDTTAAQAAIDTAKAAVDIQGAKIYTMEIVDDVTLKLNAGTVVSQFRQDINAVYKLVVDVKQAIQKLNTERNVIKREATSSANL